MCTGKCTSLAGEKIADLKKRKDHSEKEKIEEKVSPKKYKGKLR